MDRGISAIGLFFSIVLLCGFGYPPSSLMEEVDRAWKEDRISDIPVFIEKRLATVPDDITALFMARDFCIMWEFDPNKAAEYEKRLKAIIFPIRDAIGDDDEKRQFTEWLESDLLLSADPDPPVSDGEREELRKVIRDLFPDEFPGTASAETHTKVLAHYLPSAASALAKDYEVFQERKVAEIKKAGVLNLISECASLPKGEGGEIPEEEWPASIEALEPVRVFGSEKGLTLWFFRLASTYDGVILHQDAEFVRESRYSEFDDFGEGVVWFHSSL
ncbi:MAG: hypothetical protein AAGD22_13200 [Verrucomicrobiota bacterium]